MQKSPNVTKVRNNGVITSICRSKTKGAKTKAFFVHWRGRIDLNNANNMLIF